MTGNSSIFNKLPLLILSALGFHLLFCAFRLPTGVYGRRIKFSKLVNRHGEVEYFLRHYPPQTTRTIQWVLNNLPEKCTLPCLDSGDILPFQVAALVFPRILVRCDGGNADSLKGLPPFAMGKPPGEKKGYIYLKPTLEGLVLQTRPSKR